MNPGDLYLRAEIYLSFRCHYRPSTGSIPFFVRRLFIPSPLSMVQVTRLMCLVFCGLDGHMVWVPAPNPTQPPQQPQQPSKFGLTIPEKKREEKSRAHPSNARKEHIRQHKRHPDHNSPSSFLWVWISNKFGSL
ncbi:hypothetical protein VTJ04DRAFT_8894 [Mycothermus thermophilus]|uniref:uncharacterized protein n=1 Tax=Humicola insolens TaxID=85995 RepID=UPI00374399F5